MPVRRLLSRTIASSILFALATVGIVHASPAWAQEAAPTAKPASPEGAGGSGTPEAASHEEPSWFEFSLANAYMFPTDKIFRYDDNVELAPTNALLLLVDYFITYSWRARLSYNLRTTLEQRFVDGVLQEKVSPSTVSLGLSWVPLAFDFRESSRVEFEGTLSGGVVLDDGYDVIPTWMGRISLMQDANEGITVYLGVIYEILRNEAGPYYGVGYRF